MYKPTSHTQMNSSPIKKLFDNIKSFRKNLCFVSSSTMCSKIEGILTADYRRMKTYNSYSHGLRTPNEDINQIYASEKMGRCGRQNMLPLYLTIWDWD